MSGPSSGPPRGPPSGCGPPADRRGKIFRAVSCLRARSRPACLLAATTAPKLKGMFAVDEATAEAIRRAWHEGGELSGIVEFKRHFPLISDHEKARMCVRIIVGWKRAGRKPIA